MVGPPHTAEAERSAAEARGVGGEEGGGDGEGPGGLFRIGADQRLEVASGVRAGDREHPPVLECYVLSVIHG